MHVAIAAGDRVIGKAHEHTAVVGDELAERAERRQRVAQPVEHVDERHQLEPAAAAGGEHGRDVQRVDVLAQDRNAELAAARRRRGIDVERDRFAAEVGERACEEREPAAEVERARGLAAQRIVDQPARELPVDLTVRRRHGRRCARPAHGVVGAPGRPRRPLERRAARLAVAVGRALQHRVGLGAADRAGVVQGWAQTGRDANVSTGAWKCARLADTRGVRRASGQWITAPR